VIADWFGFYNLTVCLSDTGEVAPARGTPAGVPLLRSDPSAAGWVAYPMRAASITYIWRSASS